MVCAYRRPRWPRLSVDEKLLWRTKPLPIVIYYLLLSTAVPTSTHYSTLIVYIVNTKSKILRHCSFYVNISSTRFERRLSKHLVFFIIILKSVKHSLCLLYCTECFLNGFRNSDSRFCSYNARFKSWFTTMRCATTCIKYKTNCFCELFQPWYCYVWIRRIHWTPFGCPTSYIWIFTVPRSGSRDSNLLLGFWRNITNTKLHHEWKLIHKKNAYINHALPPQKEGKASGSP